MASPEELIDRALDGETQPAEWDELLGWLEAPENLEAYVDRADVHVDLRRSLVRRRGQRLAVEACERGVPDAVRAPHAIRRRIVLGAVAATISLALLIGVPRLFDAFSTSVPVVHARIAYESNARWSDSGRSVGDAVGADVLKLEVGIARLDFENGATVTLQGPAEFEILDEDRTRLHRGMLTARVPESAIGFEVETPSADVVDLGTAFGVSVGMDGETDVCVFEGEVEVSRGDSDDRRATRRVTEGSAVRTRPMTDEIDTVAYEVGRFEEGWPVTSGVLQATGLLRFVSPGPEFVPGRYEDSKSILVFPESHGVVLESPLPIDLGEPGRYERVHRRGEAELVAGRRVRSYLLQLDPVGRLEQGEPGKARAIGQITFDRPIVGLIAATETLNATDGRLGHPRGDYGSIPRGIEPLRPRDLPDAGRDVVTLSEDRHTLSLDLSAGSAVDQIRVVVDESN